MSSTIDQAPLGPERLPQESTRAYRAFCIYRDLGPDRSLDQAWKRFCAASDPAKDRGSARRPGHWAAWSQKYQWVERAEGYDDFIEEENRSAAAGESGFRAPDGRKDLSVCHTCRREAAIELPEQIGFREANTVQLVQRSCGARLGVPVYRGPFWNSDPGGLARPD